VKFKRGIVYIVLFTLLTSLVTATATNPGHPSSEIGGSVIADRTFQAADYSFQNKLGIGVSNPGASSAKLQVATDGTDNAVSIIATDGSTQSVYFVPKLSSGGYNSLSQPGDMGLIFDSGSIGTGNLVIAPWASGFKGIRITSAGYVGIGVSSPSGQLHVTQATGSGFFLERDSTHINKFAMTISGGDGLVSNSLKMFLTESTGDIGLRAASSGDMQLVLKNSGNVGIGATSPTAELEVVDSDDYAQLRLSSHQNVDAWRGSFFEARRSRGTASTPLAVISGDFIGYFDIWAYDGNSYERAGQLTASIDGTVSDGIVPLKWAFNVMNTSGSSGAAMTIRSSRDVGIGTLVPGARLQVEDNIADSTIGNLLILDSQNQGVGSGGAIQFQNDFVEAQIQMVNTASGKSALAFLTDDGSVAERVRITNTGKVGIGTTDPVGTLSVEGAAETTPDNPSFIINGTGTGNNMTMGLRYNSVANAWIQSNGGLILQPKNGNVGIGDTSPTGLLTVGSGDKFTVDSTGNIFVIDGGKAIGTALLQLGDDSFFTDVDVGNTLGLFGVGDSTKGALKLGSAGPTLFGDAGKLGIGTIIPSNTLDVEGGIRHTSALNYNGSIGGAILTINGGEFISRQTNRGAVRIGKDDAMVIGSGESPDSVSANVAMTVEHTYVTSDNNVYFYTGQQSGWAPTKVVIVDANAQVDAAGGFTGQPYGYIRTTQDSTPIDNDATDGDATNTQKIGFGVTEVATTSGVTWNSGTSEFDITQTGVYEVMFIPLFDSSALVTTTFSIYVGGSAQISGTTRVHSSVDPVTRALQWIGTITDVQSVYGFNAHVAPTTGTIQMDIALLLHCQSKGSPNPYLVT